MTTDLNGYIFYKIYESVEGSFLNKNRTQILLGQTSFITKPYFDFFLNLSFSLIIALENYIKSIVI